MRYIFAEKHGILITFFFSRRKLTTSSSYCLEEDHNKRKTLPVVSLKGSRGDFTHPQWDRDPRTFKGDLHNTCGLLAKENTDTCKLDKRKGKRSIRILLNSMKRKTR